MTPMSINAVQRPSPAATSSSARARTNSNHPSTPVKPRALTGLQGPATTGCPGHAAPKGKGRACCLPFRWR